MKKLEKRLKALADGTRLKILGLLSVRPCCVCELSAVIGYTQPTLTRHLQKLTEAGFLSVERRGFFQIYRLAPEDQEAERLLALVLSEIRETTEYERLVERLRVEGRLPNLLPTEENGSKAYELAKRA
ncbi:ArsR/SmtB family transcription factor [Thermosulfurimonas dismutans]|nr:metalloregulator ArsR/SmtB family transcription factor [Thermosulfurimonas dismutans]